MTLAQRERFDEMSVRLELPAATGRQHNRPHTKHRALINVDFITVFYAHSRPKASLYHCGAHLNLRDGNKQSRRHGGALARPVI